MVKDLVDLLEAARKNSLAAIERTARQALSNPKALQAEPFRCFAIAHRGRAREEILLAAKYTLARPLMFQEIDLITAADLLRLLTYHRRCGDAVYALRNDISWMQSRKKSSQGSPLLSEKPQSFSETSKNVLMGGGEKKGKKEKDGGMKDGKTRVCGRIERLAIQRSGLSMRKINYVHVQAIRITSHPNGWSTSWRYKTSHAGRL